MSQAEIRELLTSLNDGIPPSAEEMAWVAAMQMDDQHATNSRRSKGAGHPPRTGSKTSLLKHGLHRAVVLWYAHVHTRAAIESQLEPAGSGANTSNAGVRRRAMAVQLPVHKAWVEATFRHEAEGLFNRDGSVSLDALEELMEILSGGEVDPSEMQFVAMLSDQHVDGRIMKADLGVALAMWRGLRNEMGRIEDCFDKHGEF